jgi:isopentenyldiphosphate isomerase
MIEQSIIVNENDEIIGYKDRNKVKENDIFRISALWVENNNNEILIAQRSLKKEHNPGKWGSAVAGRNEKNETYEENIIKEAEEEIGLKNYKFKKAHKIKTKNNKFLQWFTLVLDKDIKEFKLQKEEVEDIKWIKKEKLKKEINKDPEKFTSSLIEAFNHFCK